MRRQTLLNIAHRRQVACAASAATVPSWLSNILDSNSGLFANPDFTGAVVDGATVGSWQGSAGPVTAVSLGSTHGRDPIYQVNAPCGPALYFDNTLVNNLAHNLELLGLTANYNKCNADFFEIISFCMDPTVEHDGQFHKLISHGETFNDFNGGTHVISFNQDFRRSGEGPSIIQSFRPTGRRVGALRFKASTNIMTFWLEGGAKQYDVPITPEISAKVYRHFISGLMDFGAVPLGGWVQLLGHADYSPTDSEVTAAMVWAQKRFHKSGNIFIVYGNSNTAFSNNFATNWFQKTMDAVAADASWNKAVHSRNCAINAQNFDNIVSGTGTIQQSVGLANCGAKLMIPGVKTYALLDEFVNTWSDHTHAQAMISFQNCVNAILATGVTELVVTNGQSTNPAKYDPSSTGENKPVLTRDALRVMFPHATAFPHVYSADSSTLTWADPTKLLMFDQWELPELQDYTNTDNYFTDGVHRLQPAMDAITAAIKPYYLDRVHA